jgi:RNA polymerase sigma-70 factor (ECF subfamily)
MNRNKPNLDLHRSTAPELAFSDIVIAHQPALLAYVTGLTGGDRARAEDVVQETYVRAWRHFERIRSRQGSLFGWLARVAHNLVVDGHRGRCARPTEVDAEVAPVPEADQSEHVLSRLVVLQALAATYLRDRTAAEAAAVLGVPVGTVKSRVYYGLRRLRAVLDAEALAS